MVALSLESNEACGLWSQLMHASSRGGAKTSAAAGMAWHGMCSTMPAWQGMDGAWRAPSYCP